MLSGTTQFLHGKEDILDHIYATRIGCRFHAAPLVGVGGNNSNRVFELVDRLSQRLVLNQEGRLLFCRMRNISKVTADPQAGSSNADAPITTGLDIAAHNLR